MTFSRFLEKTTNLIWKTTNVITASIRQVSYFVNSGGKLSRPYFHKLLQYFLTLRTQQKQRKVIKALFLSFSLNTEEILSPFMPTYHLLTEFKRIFEDLSNPEQRKFFN